MKLDSLHDLLLSELRDLYSAETQLVKALPRSGLRPLLNSGPQPLGVPGQISEHLRSPYLQVWFRVQQEHLLDQHHFERSSANLH